MKHRIHNQRGVIVIMPLVLMGLIATISALILQQSFRDRVWFDRQQQKIQTELLQNDLNSESFCQRFVGQQSIMTTQLNNICPDFQGEYSITVDPTIEPTGIIVTIK